MKQELKERLGRLGQTRVAVRKASGSPADLVLRPAERLADVKTISAIEALKSRGTPLIKAKRAIESMVDDGEVAVHVPAVENLATLGRELSAAGVRASIVPSEPVDVKSLRAGLGLTQEQFALRFGFDIDAVQNWEQGRCQPERAANSYLRVIASRPKEVAAALEENAS